MAEPKNAMEIYRLLDKSNCRQCGDKTCLAFAGAVFTGNKSLDQCPKLEAEVLHRYAKGESGASTNEQLNHINDLKGQVRRNDLAAASRRVGADYQNGRLTLSVMGKPFSVNSQGDLMADIHVNPWIAVPFLNYVLYAKGVMPAGSWCSFRELDGGKERYSLFRKRGELPIKALADANPGFFDDLVHLFGGTAVDRQFQSDISVVLHPLPKIPIMICYWQPEDDLQSSLNLYFDTTATDNLDIGSLFSLGTGLAQMFIKLSRRHGTH